jgi:hypothetical protein
VVSDYLINIFDSVDNNTIFDTVSNYLINNIKYMSCTPSNPKLDKLLELTNNDVRKSTEYLATIEDTSFREWYQEKTGRDFNEESIDANTVNAIIAYNNRETINTQDYVQNVRTSRTGVFGNDIAKEDHAINILSTIYLKSQGSIRKALANRKRKGEKEVLKDKAGNELSPQAAVKLTMITYLNRHLKENDKKLTQEQKTYIGTIIRNLYDGGNYNRNELFDIVVNSPEVISLSKEFGIDTNEDYETNDDAKEGSEQDGRQEDPETIASLRADWSELADQRKDIDKNVSKEVKEWFARLPKTNSNSFINEKPDTASDTYSGIAESAGFSSSFKALNNYGNFSSVEAMVESFHTIAERFEEVSHLEYAARLLEDEANVQIRNKIFTQLKQSIWERNEVVYSQDGSNVVTKNRNTFPKLNLQNKILNSFDSLIHNPSIMANDIAVLDELKNRLSTLKNSNTNEIQEITEQIAAIFNKYNFGINRQGVVNYVRNFGDNQLSNISSIVDDLLEFNKVVGKATNLLKIDNEAQRIYYAGEYAKTKENEEYVVVPFDKSQLQYKGGYANDIANRISDRFKDYQIVDSEFNSINAENNLVSDILKNNYISKFFERINDNRYNDNPTANAELRDYLVKFTNIPQYQYSNILIEKTLSNGKVIPGLLRLTDTGYELTEYYREFGAQLYNGVSNKVTGKVKSYKDINALEWDIITLNEYANNGDNYEMAKGVKKSKFFTQTPSDAPKTFVFNSYKLDIDGLFNKTYKGRTYKGQLTSLPNNGIFVFGSNPLGINGNPNKGTGGAALSAYKYFGVKQGEKMDNKLSDSGKAYGLTTVNAPKVPKTDNEIRANILKLYDYARQNPTKDFYIAYTGNANKSNLNGRTNRELAELFKGEIPNNIIFEEEFNLLVRDNIHNTYINHGHPIYVAYANIYAKELAEMAQAINFLFETTVENGVVTIVSDENGKPKIKEEFKDLRKSEARLNYHYRKSILDSNGNPTGNVFKFRSLLIDKVKNLSRYNSETAKSVDMNWLFEGGNVFSPLYGGKNSEISLIQDENGEYNIRLTGGLRNSVYNYIDNYINYRIQEAIAKYSSDKEFVDKYKNASQESFNSFISEMVLNYEIQYNNLNDMFFGDEAYYKDSRDTIKRNKEYQAGGLAYAGYDLYNVQKHLGDITVAPNKTISIDSSFKYITLEDVQSSGKVLDDLKKQLDIANVSKETRAFILKQFSKDKSEVTDAQSFITLDEFVRRMYLRGEYDSYKDLIEALYDETKPIDNVKLGELSKKIQVQKNFYYDLEIDNDAKLANPIQIKNAEFVLIPRFLGNSELGALAKYMTDNNIGQVNFTTTEKATTNRVLEFWDSHGKFPSKEKLKQFNLDVQTKYKTGWYSNLYTQQDIPQHMDGENKAGLQIVKKLIDNIGNTPEGQSLIKDFFDNFTANIQDSFKDAASRIGVEIDAKGNVVYEGNQAKIDNNKFISLIKDELTRRGLDSNYRKYAEINPETGLPYMPAWTNLVRSKIENIVNSIFTNRVTRQVLPGFHASQVSDIGMTELSGRSDLRDLMQSRVEEKHGYSLGRKLTYHKDGSQIVEILLPKWMVKAYNTYDAEGNLIKEVTLKDLQSAGLDTMIGYRIPTEGKQSVAVMKVVGLLDESQGSTIVVPDEWVLQTGADFDIDSIYGIYHAAYFDKEGKPHKVEYIDGDNEVSTYRRYIGYVNSLIDRETRKATSSEFTKEEFKEARKAAIETVRKANEEYDKFLTDQVRDLIAETDETWAELPREVKDNLTITFKSKELKFGERVDAIVSKMDFYENEYKNNETIAKFAQQYRNIQSIINEQREFYQNVKDNAEQLAIDYADETRRARLEETINARAEIVGAMSLEEFSKLTVAQQNTRDARNNKIVDTFIKIMNLPVSIGENLSSSNFEDIKAAKANIFEGLSETYRNINSVIAQNWYRDANMSGARLKAISVNRDNFASISNKAKTIVDGAHGGFRFTYTYSTEKEAKDAQSKLRKRFRDVTRKGKEVTVDHNQLGWSYDNLNIDNRLITPYSSETTALILDGVKEGGVPNVDLYTFDVYKSIVDCGANYETSILFINQPVITELIARQNANDNVFGETGFNPLIGLRRDMYIRLARTVGIPANSITKKTRLKDVKKMLESRGIEINEDELLEEGIKVTELREHLKDDVESTSYNNTDNLIYQIKALRAFEYFKEIGDQINSNMMVITSDKFGAGKSANEIDNVINRINDIKENNVGRIKKGQPVLKAVTEEGNKYLIDAIYPKTNFNTINDINQDELESVYPSLYYQLKYSCIATEKIIRDSEIFKTQTPQFRELVSKFGIRNLQTIQQLESFIINMSQAQSNFVNTNRFITRSDNEFIPSYNLNLISSQQDTRARLYGYTDIVGSFDMSDMSEKNVEAFMKLSPANKVALIQRYTSDNNLFKNLNVEYKGRRNSYDRITIVDSTISTESQYQMFRNAWHNNNPFIKLATMDLIRYSMVVEGYKFKGGTVSKIIPVELLYGQDTGIDSDNGVSSATNIINDSDRTINSMIQYGSEIGTYERASNDAATIEKLRDLFFRTNPNNPDVLVFENKKYKESNKITFNRLGVGKLSFKEAQERGMITGSENNRRYRHYAKTNDNNKTLRLYKLVYYNDTVYMLPTNPLEQNEIGEVSVNPDNNRMFLPLDILEDVSINQYDAAFISSVNIGITSDTRKFMVLPTVFERGADTLIEEVFPNSIVLTSPIKEQQIDTSRKYIVAITDNNILLETIESLDAAGVHDYVVAAPNMNYNNIRRIINERNNADIAAKRLQAAMTKLDANEVQLRKKKPDNSESPYYAQLKASINQTINDVNVNGIGFVPVLQTVIDNTGFRPNGYFRYEKEGNVYIVTNLGRITTKSVNLAPDYSYSRKTIINSVSQLEFPRRNALTQVVKENSRLDKFANNNIIRVQTEENFINEDVLESALVDNDREINEYISRVIESVERSNANVEEAALNDAFRSFAAIDLRSNTATKLNDNLREQALKIINGYTNRRIDDFLFDIHNFYTTYVTNPDGTYKLDENGNKIVMEKWGITNKKLFDRMLEDETLRTRYEMFLDNINRFVEDYSIIEAIQPYDIDEAHSVSETEEEIEGLRRTNDMLKQIKDKFKRIKDLDNVVKRSTKMYFDSYITSLSSDPRVQSNMLSITEAFEDENFFQFWLADSQETHIPIVQIVLKQMMNQLRASEISARDKKIAFTTAISTIIEDAKNNGINVSLNDILDENGNLLLPYNESFTDKLRSLKEAVKLAQIDDPNGRDGLIYKKAKDELEKFLIDNVEREYNKKFYQDYYNMNQILNKYPQTYVKLMKILHEEGDILSTMIDNDYSTLTVQNARRLEELRHELAEMRATIDMDGNYKENYQEANAVNNYLSRRRQLNNKYKESKPKDAFTIRYKQAIEGLQYPETSETYRESVEWLKANTDYKLKGEFLDELKKAYMDTRLGNPFDSFVRTMAYGKYDSEGVIDGTKFTDVQIANLKKHQEQMFAAAVGRVKPNEQKAQEWLDNHVSYINTVYYEAMYVAMNKMGKEVFDKWYIDNHVVNPITKEYEPLPIWRQMVVKDEANNMEYSAKYKWLETKVKEKYKNPNYDEVKLQPSTNKYRNDKYYGMNNYQQQLYNEVDSLLNELVKDKRSRAYINRGYLPNQAIEQPSQGFADYWQDFKRSHGWYNTPNKSDIELNLYKRFSNAPMLHSLSEVKLLPIREQQEGETKEEYLTYVRETQAKNNELRKQRAQENAERNNPNVLERLNSFIDSMYNFNTRNDIARLAKITSNQLRNMDIIKRNPNDKLMDNRLLSRITGKQEIRTTKSDDSNIVKHFENQVRKLVFNEFEMDEGTRSKVSRVMRNMVSSKFMMLNITGGIANVLYGKTQIQMEMAAGQFFKYKDFRKGENEWMQNIGSYLADAYNETTNNETNAVIRLFNVIESDMVTERYGKGNNPMGKLENLLFIQQTAGEHYMQNATLLAMLHSHRVVNVDGKNKIMSFEQYAMNLREEALLKVLRKNSPELVSKYETFKDKVLESYVEKERYVKFKADIITDFLRSIPKELRQEFKTTYKEDTKEERIKFEQYPSFRESLILKNGVATLKKDSGLTNDDIAAFRNKVISVNHQIHGIYDKIGANQLQQSWWGALLMQFHKHLVPGYQKRFGYRLGHFDGIYNETRESISKGTYVSLGEFIAMPFKKYYELNDSNELQAVRTLQGIAKGYADFVANLTTYYNILPEYDKANIRRCLGEWIAITKAVALFVVGKLMLDDDDDSTQVADYILYSADRLMSETIQYTPWGMINEGQKLYSQPVAALSIASDNLKLLEACCSYIVTGNPDDLYYNSGTYSGENKLKVNIMKQIPLLNQINKHQRLGANNSYYKVRSSPFSGLGQIVANMITDEDEE